LEEYAMKIQRPQTSDWRSKYHKHSSLNPGMASDRFRRSPSQYINSKLLSVQILTVLIFLACILPHGVSAQVQAIDDLSFIVPQGWKYESKPGSAVGALSLSDGRDYCMLLITQPLAVSPNANIDFTSVWEGIITPVLHDPPPRDRPLEHRSTFGYSGKLKGDTSPGRGQNRWVGLFLLETGTKAIPVIVVASSNDVYLHLYDTVVQFMNSIRIVSVKAQAPKTSITMLDLVGEWKTGSSDSHVYVDRYTGAYAGSYIITTGNGYIISADGSYPPSPSA
jgi:hypothetical protein